MENKNKTIIQKLSNILEEFEFLNNGKKYIRRKIAIIANTIEER